MSVTPDREVKPALGLLEWGLSLTEQFSCTIPSFPEGMHFQSQELVADTHQETSLFLVRQRNKLGPEGENHACVCLPPVPNQALGSAVAKL